MATYKWALTERGYKEVDWKDYKHKEYVAMFADETEKGGRYICVTGDSLGSIACEVWRNVFN